MKGYFQKVLGLVPGSVIRAEIIDLFYSLPEGKAEVSIQEIRAALEKTPEGETEKVAIPTPKIREELKVLSNIHIIEIKKTDKEERYLHRKPISFSLADNLTV